MVSAVDPTVIVDDLAVDKTDLRNLFITIKAELEELQSAFGVELFDAGAPVASSLTYGASGFNKDTHHKRLFFVDNSGGDITLTVDVEDPDYIATPNGVLFFIRVGSASNLVSFAMTGAGAALRSFNGYSSSEHDNTANPVFLGLSQATSEVVYNMVVKVGTTLFIFNHVRDTAGKNLDYDNGGGGGNMLSSVYDPQAIADDAFDYANMTGSITLAVVSDAGALAALDTVGTAQLAAAVGRFNVKEVNTDSAFVQADENDYTILVSGCTDMEIRTLAAGTAIFGINKSGGDVTLTDDTAAVGSGPAVILDGEAFLLIYTTVVTVDVHTPE